MKKKIIAGMLVLSAVSGLYANSINNNSMDDAKTLYSCMVKNMTGEQKKYIKEYGFLSFAYPDKTINKFLNINKKEIKDISLKTGKALTDLMINKCKDETKTLFLNNSLSVAYMKFAQVINGVVSYVLLNPKDKDPVKQKEVREWLKQGIESNKDFGIIIKEFYQDKEKMEKEKK